MLRLGLEIADRIVAALPSPVAYALADLAGDAWYRLAPARRRLVAANLARVCAATGRPVQGRPFRDLVRSAFRNHARYYVELLRAPHYPVDRIDEIMDVPALGGISPQPWVRGPGMFIGSHLGNFEPFGAFLAAHGIRPLVPDGGDRAAGAVRVSRRAARRRRHRAGAAQSSTAAAQRAAARGRARSASSATVTSPATASR